MLATLFADDIPHLSITIIMSAVPSAPTADVQRVMREIGQCPTETDGEVRAADVSVPFSFRAVHDAGNLTKLNLDPNAS